MSEYPSRQTGLAGWVSRHSRALQGGCVVLALASAALLVTDVLDEEGWSQMSWASLLNFFSFCCLFFVIRALSKARA